MAINAKEIIAEVRANHALLEACVGPHEFVEHEVSGRLFTREKCRLCGGHVDVRWAAWYRRGMEDARGCVDCIFCPAHHPERTKLPRRQTDCESCQSSGRYWNDLLREWRPCIDCNEEA